MFVDAKRLDADTEITSDLCIVGGGVAGIVLARELMNTNLDICVLESGGVKSDDSVQELCRGEIAGLPYYPLDTARLRQLGGSSHKWLMELGGDEVGARLRPMDAIDFEKRDWVPNSGWPFDREHIEPYYERAHRFCSAGTYSYDAADWQEHENTSAFAFAQGGRVQSSMYHFVRREVFAEVHRAELERASRVRVVLNATVLEVETDQDGSQATGILCIEPGGKRFRAKAKIYVLALGGIETPRLMLLSRQQHTAGLGNQNDLVGRFFMEHPHLWSGYLVPADKKAFDAAGLYRVHHENDSVVLAQLTMTEETLRRERLLGYSVYLEPGFRKRASIRSTASRGLGTVRHVMAAIRNGESHELSRHLSTLFPTVNELSIAVFRRSMRTFEKLIRAGRKYEVFLLNHMTEQVPNPESRVSLSEERDRLGQNLVKLDWRLTSDDIHSIRRAQEIMNEEVIRTNFGSVDVELIDDSVPESIHGGWHHMGTTRMHQDPKHGVVDSNCKVHGVENLYIAGASVFPTGGFANPVLTILALAIRLADQLRETGKSM